MLLYIHQHFLNVIIMSTIATLMFHRSSSNSEFSFLSELLLSLLSDHKLFHKNLVKCWPLFASSKTKTNRFAMAGSWQGALVKIILYFIDLGLIHLPFKKF